MWSRSFPSGRWQSSSTSCASRYGDSACRLRRGEPRLYVDYLRRFFLARQFPGLGIFPRYVDGVVEVQKQAFAAVEKSEAEKIIVDKRREWTQDDVEQTEAAAAFGDCHLRAQRRVAVHVVDVVCERGVGVVEKGADLYN